MKAILVDLDGTLCDLNGRDPYDASTCESDLPHPEIIDYVNERHGVDAGYFVIILTGRSDKYLEQTLEWLTDNGVRYNTLFMRRDGDFRKAAEFKKETYESFPSTWSIKEVIEDDTRVIPMWRKLGLKVRQVSNGQWKAGQQ